MTESDYANTERSIGRFGTGLRDEKRALVGRPKDWVGIGW